MKLILLVSLAFITLLISCEKEQVLEAQFYDICLSGYVSGVAHCSDAKILIVDVDSLPGIRKTNNLTIVTAIGLHATKHNVYFKYRNYIHETDFNLYTPKMCTADKIPYPFIVVKEITEEECNENKDVLSIQL